ncbi:BTB/POZ domain-containing protein [Ditylenchus destructor]|nr:BTB/POZ domain-containing protein [Ditylenchus destructor]
MFANIISKRALSISRIVCSQVHSLTSIYGIEVKSTAKFSYSIAQKIKPLDFCIKREKHSESTKDLQNSSEALSDYTDFVILAEAVVADGSGACIHNTFWEFDFGSAAHFKDIHPRNETCHAEILFIDGKNSITHKIRKEFRIGDNAEERYRNSSAVIRILDEKQKFLKEFENRWAKDVTFVANGEKCAGDRQYLSAISPVFKKMLQDHAQDEITLEGVESADMLKDFFLAISPLRVQPNPSNVVPLLKLAQDYGIPFLMRCCEEHLKHCYEIPTKDRYLLAMKYGLNSLLGDIVKILRKEKEIPIWKFERVQWERLFDEERKIRKEFNSLWAYDVTFDVHAMKYKGDRQYLSAISPVFKKILQDHAQDEIKLEGVGFFYDRLHDFFMAISPLRVQPNPTNVVPLLTLAHHFDIPFLVRSCEEHLKQAIPTKYRSLLAKKYSLNSLHEDIIKILKKEMMTSDKVSKATEILRLKMAEESILEKNQTTEAEFDLPFLIHNCEEQVKKLRCYEIPMLSAVYEMLYTKYSWYSLHDDIIKIVEREKEMNLKAIESEKQEFLKTAEQSFVQAKKKENIEEEFSKENILKEFENRWAKDVTFVVNGEKCAGDRQYLSAISPVFKKELQDHAQDEITLEGVESADVLKDFFLAVSPLRIQPTPTNVVSLLNLAHDYDIPYLMRNCEECLKQCSEIPAIDRFFLAMKYELGGLKLCTEQILSTDDLVKILGELNDLEEKRELLDRVSSKLLAEKSLSSDDLIKILGELHILEQEREVLERLSNNRLAEILKEKKDVLSDARAEFLLQIIAERLETENSVIDNGLAKILKEKKEMLREPGNQFLFDLIAERLEKLRK